MTEAVVFVLPALTVRLPVTTGETHSMEASSSSERTSSIVRMTVPLELEVIAQGFLLPMPPTRRVWMVTVSRFVPIEAIDSVTEAVVPWPMAMSTMTLMTPMMTPSIVRKERILLPEMALKAIEIVCFRCIR